MALYDLLGFMEKKLAKLQGKGYGSSTIAAEISSIVKLLDGHQPQLCVDIGGNVGDYSARLHQVFSEAKIVCFEPSQTNIDLLTKRFSSHDRITVEPFAVSKEAGEFTLHSDKPGSGLGSLTKRNLAHFGRDFEVTETITTLRFDDYWKDKLNGAPIDILKLDIEGHEMDAFEGAGDALASTRVVQFEFGGSNIDTRTFYQDFWYYFLEREFSLFRITPFGLAKIKKYRERDECFRTTNFLALSKRA